MRTILRTEDKLKLGLVALVALAALLLPDETKEKLGFCEATELIGGILSAGSRSVRHISG